MISLISLGKHTVTFQHHVLYVCMLNTNGAPVQRVTVSVENDTCFMF